MNTINLSYTVVADAYQRNVAKGNPGMQCRDEAGMMMLLSQLRNDQMLPEFADKMTHLIYSICENHYYMDGNKRAAVVMGALYLHVNGYAVMLEQYMQMMRENMVYVCMGRISRVLFKDMIQSLLNGDEDFDDMLKLRVLMAIDDEWANAETAPEFDYVPYFEKQYKDSQRADNWNSVDENCNEYPCLKLVFNYDWNDYGYHTWFCLWLIEENHVTRIGDVKIMHKDDDVYEHLPKNFSELDENYCSIGMDMDFYKTLKSKLGVDKAKCVLRALRDCATNDMIYEEFCSNRIFINSLMRDLSTKQVRKDARFMLDDRDMSEAYSFVYDFVPIYNQQAKAKWNLHFDYESLPYKRTYAVIGENGVGKTQMMASLVRDLTSATAPNLSQLPLLSGVMVICSSSFDAYWGIKSTNQQMPLHQCSLVQDSATTEKLAEAINLILSRGTYYTGREMLQLWEHYEKLLSEQLGEPVSSAFLEKVYYEEDGKQKVKEVKLLRNELRKLVEQMSTGQLQVFSLITYVCAYIHLNTLLIIDEPEVHLHPRFVTNFFVMLNELLELFESYAIISTHSPLVVRECVQQNVYVMKRNSENIPLVAKVPYRTFGEDLTTLYQKVFESDERDSYFYRTVREKSLKPRASYKRLVNELEAEGVKLNLNSRTLIRDCFDDMDKGDDV